MSTLNLFAFATWSLSVDGGACELKVDRMVEWCVDGTCSPVESVTADTPDRWVLSPSKTELHWTAPDTAELECNGKSVVLHARRESKSVVEAPAVPWEKLAAVLGVGPEVVVPGAWLGGTRECVEGTTAWLFDPFDRERPDVFVARDGDGWVVAKGHTGVVMCPGGKFGGVSPQP